jgi:hypothetical protein
MAAAATLWPKEIRKTGSPIFPVVVRCARSVDDTESCVKAATRLSALILRNMTPLVAAELQLL